MLDRQPLLALALVRVAHAIIENARKTYLVTDSAKLGRSAPIRIATVQEIDAYFTDRLDSEGLREVCERCGVSVVTAAQD